MNNTIETIGRFEMYHQWPPEFVEPTRDLLTEFESLIPRWCAKALVCHNSKRNGSDAEIQVDFAYRTIHITLYPSLFNLTVPERRARFLHEMMHAYAHHIFLVAVDVVQELLNDDSAAYKMTLNRLREANEGVTCDLTELVSGFLVPPICAPVKAPMATDSDADD